MSDEAEAASTAVLILGEDIRKQIADRLGLAADELDEVPVAIELSVAADVEGFSGAGLPGPLVRVRVRDILTQSPSFRSLPPESQRDLAHNMVKVL